MNVSINVLLILQENNMASCYDIFPIEQARKNSSGLEKVNFVKIKVQKIIDRINNFIKLSSSEGKKEIAYTFSEDDLPRFIKNEVICSFEKEGYNVYDEFQYDCITLYISWQ